MLRPKRSKTCANRIPISRFQGPVIIFQVKKGNGCIAYPWTTHSREITNKYIGYQFFTVAAIAARDINHVSRLFTRPGWESGRNWINRQATRAESASCSCSPLLRKQFPYRALGWKRVNDARDASHPGYDAPRFTFPTIDKFRSSVIVTRRNIAA